MRQHQHHVCVHCCSSFRSLCALLLAICPAPVPPTKQKRHKEELERRLAEIEEARRIFSRPHVLVQAK